VDIRFDIESHMSLVPKVGIPGHGAVWCDYKPGVVVEIDLAPLVQDFLNGRPLVLAELLEIGSDGEGVDGIGIVGARTV
jgi:hypothetical protein